MKKTDRTTGQQASVRAISMIGEPSARPAMATDIPPAITIPDRVETRLGTLTFKDGFPDDATVEKVLDQLDFQRAMQAVLVAMPAASSHAIREGLRGLGPPNRTVGITDSLMDAKSLFLTANTETVYVIAWLDLSAGPVVVEAPSDVLGLVDDFWFHYVCDIGNAGPDKGQGGKYLLLPPAYDGAVPEGYFVFRSRTYNNMLAIRGFLAAGRPGPTAERIRRGLRLYPLADAANPPETTFVDISGLAFCTIHAADATFFNEVDAVVQAEPNAACDPETLGLLASIGIEKGKPFAPDARMTAILAEAALVGNATARALSYRTRLDEAYLYPDSAWIMPFVGGSYLFERDGLRILDARTLFFFLATGVTPAMAAKMVGAGSQYGAAFIDAQGRPLDGAKTYRLHLPPNIPAGRFWSVVAYDTQTRSMLQTDQQFPSTGSQKQGLHVNVDGSVDVYFGPRPPDGMENNWIQTLPSKGWFGSLRLYNPLEPFFDKTWRPGEIEEVAMP